jgi:hypothetical protein
MAGRRTSRAGRSERFTGEPCIAGRNTASRAIFALAQVRTRFVDLREPPP